MNVWKLMSFILILIVIVEVVFLLQQLQQKQTYDIGGFEIKKDTVDKLSEAVGEGEFIFCSVNDNKCIRMGKIKDG